MSVKIVTTQTRELVPLSNMVVGQAFLDGDILIRTDKRDADQDELILVVQLDAGEVFSFDEDNEYQPVKLETRIVT
ncbi:hypothetical protein VPHD21_0202 [Vibrio phage D21]